MTGADKDKSKISEKDALWLWRPPEGGYIGRRGFRPKEAPEKVTGRALYTNDVYQAGESP